MTTQDNILYFDNCSTVEMAHMYGTPLILISESHLRKKAQEIHECFLDLYEDVRAVYASKAFLNSAMCKIVHREGLGLDVVSGGELYIAKNSGFPMSEIIFHGNNKSESELRMALEFGVGRIVVDNASELTLLEKVCEELQLETSILFRITPEIDTDTHAYIATANRDSKFGFPLESVVSTYLKSANSKWITPLGIHFHVGSQLQSNRDHLAALEVALSLIEALSNEGLKVKELNAGGGFGVKYTETDNETTLTTFVKPIMDRIVSWSLESGIERPKIIIEPGRWFVANAGLTLYEIGARKTVPGVRTYISVNGGIPDNIRPALYTARYRAVIANKMNIKETELVTIAGKCCESGDILIRDIHLPVSDRGDLLAVFGTGAYTESMASNYNYLTRPAVVLVNDGKSYVMRRRETFEDMIRRDQIPAHLADC